jgi:hypothetical protein
MQEYDFETLKLSEEQEAALLVGMADPNDLNNQIRDLLNSRAQEGWSPLTPIIPPTIWFARESAE